MKLSNPVTTIPYISESYATKLSILGIQTIKDFITYFPRKYVDSSQTQTIKEILFDESNIENQVQIKAHINSFKNIFLRSKKSMQTAVLEDETGEITAQWFNQVYLKNVMKEGKEFMFVGKLKKRGNKFIIYPNLFEPVLDKRELVHTGRITPEYSLTAGVAKKWFRNRMKSVIDSLDDIELEETLSDFAITPDILRASLAQMHFPESIEKVEEAMDLLTIVELVHLQLKLEAQREKTKKFKPPKINNHLSSIVKFLTSLPFELTNDQKTAIDTITSSIKNHKLLNSLIQGDVGSGKTIIAVATSLFMVEQGYQAVVLAPTTILAKQHYESFSNFLKDYGISIDLAISSKKDTKKSDIIIGTTAVLARKQDLIENVGIIIIDEQHRFGVTQREELLQPFTSIVSHKYYPHFLNMTATPIPRTIAQTLFGDIQIIEIKTKPKSRKPIQSFFVPSKKREDNIAWLKDHILKNQEQVYWVCPLIENSESIKAKSAEEVFRELTKALPNYKIGLLHGRMKPNEKTEIMGEFSHGKIDILVSTSVIEVGVDVANATAMVIESAERFGLAQLHQIRGRVGRGDKQSYCFFYSSDGKKNERLEFISKTHDGMKIAEYDLAHRGPGEVYGTAQTGVPNLKIAQLDEADAIKKSKIISQKLYNQGVKEIELFN